jgi:hypothetical protein
VEKQSYIQIGGNVERALKGDYIIDIKAILQEAWQKTLQNRVSINGGLAFVMVVGMLTSFFLISHFGGFESVYQQPQLLMMIQVVVTIITWPFLAGVEMMGVLHAVNAKTHVSLIFAFLKRASWVILCALLTSTLINIGLQLFVVPGLFLAVVFSLAIPLVIEKKLSPLKAIVLSIQALRFQWFRIFALYFVLTVLVIFSLIPFVLLADSAFAMLGLVIFMLALTYIAPLFYNTKGILYREIFGVTVQHNANSNPSSDDVFLA